MSKTKRVLIVGGVAGGASAAARIRRLSEDAEIIVFERGDYISFANCGLPYHIGDVIKQRERLIVQTPESMRKRFGIDVRIRCEVIGIDRDKRQVLVRDLRQDREYTEKYDALVLSPGAQPIRPDIGGVDAKLVFTLRSIGDMDAIKKVADEREAATAVVVGGGYIGLEMTEALVGRGLRVVLVELADQIMATVDFEMAAALGRELRLNGVDLRLKTSVTAISEIEDDKLMVQLSNGESLESDMVVLAIGVRPEVGLARASGLEIGERGGIVVDSRMRTSDPSIYAVGDAVEVTDFVGEYPALIPLAGPANRQGRIAADNICGRESAYRNTQGTAICKVFNLAAATTGMNEKNLKRTGRRYEKVYVHPTDHAEYYPDASRISLKLLFDPDNGQILGAQAFGAKGVDKRIDVIAVAMRAGMTVDDLQHLELSYAPPFGSAKDPVNYAGFVASNVISGDMVICHAEDMANPTERQIIVDVRTPAEAQAGGIDGAVNIPLDELRGRLDELGKDKELLVYCGVGLRGYLACRILSQKGFKCRNLAGGYTTYKAFQEDRQEAAAPGKEMGGHLQEASSPVAAAVAKHIDACGLQCPGPIIRLKEEIDALQEGQAVTIATTDPGFTGDVKGWCDSTGNSLQSVTTEQGRYCATIVKGDCRADVVPQSAAKKKTIVVFSSDFDKAMAAFIIANGAVAMGSEVTMFFTFWGLNLLRKSERVGVKKTLIEKMFGFMMPRGPEKTSLSKMNMGGMGTRMIKGIMKQKNVSSLAELIDRAGQSGIRLIACSMSMGLMGIKRDELIEPVEEGGVAMYLNHAESSGVNLFI